LSSALLLVNQLSALPSGYHATTIGNLSCKGGEEHTMKWSIKIFADGKPVVTKDQFMERVVNVGSSCCWEDWGGADGPYIASAGSGTQGYEWCGRKNNRVKSIHPHRDSFLFHEHNYNSCRRVQGVYRIL
jgi:hypothetical protein